MQMIGKIFVTKNAKILGSQLFQKELILILDLSMGIEAAARKSRYRGFRKS